MFGKVWIKKETYHRWLKLMDRYAKLCDRLRSEINRLYKQLEIKDDEIRRLRRLLADNDIEDIDFPNSKKGGFEGSDIFLM